LRQRIDNVDSENYYSIRGAKFRLVLRSWDMEVLVLVLRFVAFEKVTGGCVS